MELALYLKMKNKMGILANCKLDDANYHLRQGTASEENAIAYIEMWNRPGMRLTKAELRFYTVPTRDIVLTVPEIRIK